MVAYTVGRSSLLSWLAAALARNRPAALAALTIIGRVIFIVGALAAFVLAAWIIAVPLGLFVAGLSLLVLEWVVRK
jgi:hypothetical protein